MRLTSSTWWKTEDFDRDEPIPPVFYDLAGPHEPALVQVNHNGSTQLGWGLKPPKGAKDGFMPRYVRGEFRPRRALHSYKRTKQPFAFVMRSMQIVCIDIDGKNGGYQHAKRLGFLPPTLAETSKSANGLHLFYWVPAQWDLETGFGTLNDRIGIEQGVDFRGTGCVYHYATQRWNDRPLVDLPDHLAELLLQRTQRTQAATNRIQAILESEDELEVLMMQGELEQKLAQPIPSGRRNNTLFAIGSEMKLAGIDDWQTKIDKRAKDLGLDYWETDKLLKNIEKYA